MSEHGPRCIFCSSMRPERVQRLPLAEIERLRAEHVPGRAGYCFAPLCAQPSPCDAARLIAELDRRAALDVAPAEYLVANH